MPIDAGRQIRVEVLFDVHRQSVQQAAQAIQNFGSTAQQAGGHISNLGARLDVGRILTWAGAWTTAYRSIRLFESGMRDAIVSAAQLDAAMRNVNTIAKLSEAGLRDMRMAVIALSTDTRAGFRSADELAQALYQINSAGIIGAKSLDVLQAASAAARAGLTDANTAATALVSVLNAYGLSAASAGRVSDILFKTVEVGVPPFEQLAKNIGEVASSAAVAKVPVEELGLVWAAVSRVLTDANLTTTSLNRLIISFLQPTEAMSRAVQQLGFDSADTMLRQVGLVESMRRLHMVTGDNAVAIRELFDDQRAFRAATILMANSLEVLTKAQADWGKVGAETGATQRALGEQMKSHAAQVDRLRREWERVKVEMGERVVPVLGQVAHGLAEVMKWDREFRATSDERRRAWEAMLLRGVGLPSQFGPFGRPEPAFGRTPAEQTMRSALGQLAEARRPAIPTPVSGPAPLSFAELLNLFERHRALGEFTTGGELRGLGEILIPRAEREVSAARARAARLQKSLGVDAEETRKALKTVEDAEERLLRLETQRVALAKTLANEYKTQGELLKAAVESLRRVEVEAAETRLRGFGLDFELAFEPLKKFRDLMGDTAKVREQMHRLTMQNSEREIAMLRRLIETEADPRARVGFAQRLQEAIARRARATSEFEVESRQAAFATEQAELQRRIEALTGRLGQYPEGDPGRRMLEGIISRLRAQVAERPTFTAEELSRPYQQAADEIARIQRDTIDPALKKSQDEARAIAQAAYDQTLKMHSQIVDAWGAMGRSAGQAFLRNFLDVYGRIPDVFRRGGDQNAPVPERLRERSGNVYNIALNGVDISSRLDRGTAERFVEDLLGALGNSAVQRDRRNVPADVVA